jgi:hypothetical protein
MMERLMGFVGEAVTLVSCGTERYDCPGQHVIDRETKAARLLDSFPRPCEAGTLSIIAQMNRSITYLLNGERPG